MVLLCVSAAASPGGQKPTQAYAVIAGTVWTPEQRAAGGVKISVRRAGEKKVRWEAVSDQRGEFAFRVPAGAADYVVVAEPGGKARAVEKRVHIELDERAEIGLHLTE